jgi:hypothetical protein
MSDPPVILQHMMIRNGLLDIYWTLGSHTANVYGALGGHDVFTFSWEKDHPSAIDFVTAAISYLEDFNA